MNIKSKEEAFKVIENSKAGIPFEAIKYLVEYGKDKEILNKVIFQIENAYDESIFYNKESELFSPSPLWYCIVAEGQIDEKLIDSVIKLYTSTTNTWDYLNEQGLFVLGKLCEEFGDIVIERCLKKCIELNKQGSRLPYLYLYDSLYFAKEGDYIEEILELLKNPRGKWLDYLATKLAYPKYYSLLPRIKELKDYYEKLEDINFLENATFIELKEAINGIENLHWYSENIRNFYESRSNWEEHYKRLAHRFSSVPSKPNKPITEPKKKIGRNDPCPCGSGKKYKKCCLS